jgi:regulator of sigma E protease
VDFLQFIFSNIWYILLGVLGLGASIFVHELGHFWVARRRGMQVDRFSIGFGPKIVAWQDKDGVEYRLSWIPLGGYVALPQLADMRGIEGETNADLTKLPPPSYTTMMLVLGAGVVCNVIFAFFLASVLWAIGLPSAKEELSTRIGHVRAKVIQADGTSAPGPALGALVAGDEILSIDGRRVGSFSDIEHLVALGAGRDAQGRPQVEVTFRRDGEMRTATLTPAYLAVGRDEFRSIGVDTEAKPAIGQVDKDSAAEAAGLRANDEILRIDGKAMGSEEDVVAHVRASAGRPVVISFSRAGELRETTVTPRLTPVPGSDQPVPRLGVSLGSKYTRIIVHIPPWTQLTDHVQKTWWTLGSLLNRRSDIGLSKMSGPVGIADKLHTLVQIDLRLMLNLLVLINVNLAIFNLLPIPVLDGGHMVFATLGRIRGRPLPVNFMRATMSAFMALLLSLMIYVSFFDVRRLADRFWPARTAPATAPAK